MDSHKNGIFSSTLSMWSVPGVSLNENEVNKKKEEDKPKYVYIFVIGLNEFRLIRYGHSPVMDSFSTTARIIWQLKPIQNEGRARWENFTLYKTTEFPRCLIIQ